jgi:glycosyltransferase involved in cell wall biosynthesis
VNNQPIASIIIPAFNASRWIGETLNCAQRQTLRDLEIIVVDDGSTDATAAIVMRHAERDARVRLLEISNSGVGAARNVGIGEARGRYIAPLDADDLWDAEKLERQVGCIERAGVRTGLVYCWSRRVSEAGEFLGSYYPFSVEGEARRAMILRNIVTNASVPLFRAEALRQTGGYLTRADQNGAQGCEDWDLSMRVADRWHVGVVRAELVGYRQSATCMSSAAGGMARSFEIVMARARARNPDLPAELFAWAAGHFFSYLVSKSYCVGDYRGCIRAAGAAVRSDPLMLCNRQLHALAFKSLARIAGGTHLARRATSSRAPGPPPRPAAATASPTFLTRVQARRWQAALSETPSPT